MKSKLLLFLFALIFGGVLIHIDNPLLEVNRIEAQVDVTVQGSAPETAARINACLNSRGRTVANIAVCTNEGAAYLRQCGLACQVNSSADVSVSCDQYSCTLTCNNGATIRVSAPPPPVCEFKNSGCEGGCNGRYYDLYTCGVTQDKRFLPAYDYVCKTATYCPPTATKTPTPTATRTPDATPTNTPPAASTPTPTRTPGPSSTPRPSNTPGPSSTPRPSNTPGPSSTPRASSTPQPSHTPVPTPTPDFNEAMCKCDQMNVGQIALGQPIQVEAFAKVEGSDTSKAEVQGMKFRIYEGNAGAGRVRELPEKGDQPVTVIDNTPTLVRYRAEWTANPQIKSGEEYRIVATPLCVARTAAALREAQTVVLAAQDENVGFFGQIANFFAGLFGGGDEVNEGVQVAEEDEGPLAFITNFFKPQSEKRPQLQLDTFTPAQMEKEACNIMKFKIDFVSP